MFFDFTLKLPYDLGIYLFAQPRAIFKLEKKHYIQNNLIGTLFEPLIKDCSKLTFTENSLTIEAMILQKNEFIGCSVLKFPLLLYSLNKPASWLEI